MKIIDLTRLLYNQMPVWPGDPEVEIKQIQTINKHGWRLRLLKFGSHTGTHADAFSHMDENGQTLDKMPLEKFMGKAQRVKVADNFPKKVGLAFTAEKLEQDLWQKIRSAKAPFILVNKDCDFPVELERKLLQNKIVTITDLVNLEKLPQGKQFMFFGLPLKIKDGDGSPIRAVAVI